MDIYQTWYTKDLPPKMRERVELLKSQNPRFNHHLYDDEDCRNFIKEHFKPDVLNAYNSLIPGAYKADLWRLCILFIKGGIYMDIKLACVNGFKLIELTENEHLVKDRTPHKLEILNTLMVCKKGNILLYKGIRQIVENVKNKFYGNSALEPTGPGLLGNIIEQNNLRSNIDMTHFIGGNYIIYKKRFVITTVYPEYHQERDQTYDNINTKRYDALWNEKNIYR
jgi:mannosyltransferase OCH1-like enzyme